MKLHPALELAILAPLTFGIGLLIFGDWQRAVAVMIFVTVIFAVAAYQFSNDEADDGGRKCSSGCQPGRVVKGCPEHDRGER